MRDAFTATPQAAAPTRARHMQGEATAATIRVSNAGGNPRSPAVWPHQRQRVRAGTRELTGPETERERDGDVLVFDPARGIDGIELSDDPVLRLRPGAYSESVERRTD